VGRCTLADAAQSPAWLQEIERTRDYLLAQHRLAGDTPVPVRVLEAADSVLLAPERAADPAGSASGALSFLPSAFRAAPGLDDGAKPAHAPFDKLLVRALLRAPADLGWPPAIVRSGRLPLSPRTLALTSLIACAVLGGGAWYVEREAAAADAAARAARQQLVVEPIAPAPPPPPAPEIAEAPAPEAPPPPPAPPPAPTARRIEGILLRPDGEALVWLDGTLMRASEAGLQAAAGSEPALSPGRAQRKRLRVGDQWAGPAQSAAAPTASESARQAAAGATVSPQVPAQVAQGPATEAQP